MGRSAVSSAAEEVREIFTAVHAEMVYLLEEAFMDSKRRRAIVSRLRRRLRWARYLPPAEFREMLQELSEAYRVSAETGNIELAKRQSDRWRIAAEIYARPAVMKRLERPIDASIPMPPN